MRRGQRDERGSMAVEVVILAPLMLMFSLLVVAGGRYVDVEGDVQAAARDGARAASLETDYGAATQAAFSTIDASLDHDGCQRSISGPESWGPDGIVSVRVSCDVSYDDLGLLGLPGTVSIEAESHVRLDPHRSIEQ